MKIVIAPNAFKESIGPTDAARAIERGLRASLPEAELVLRPMADGGDGTLEVLIEATGGKRIETEADDPLGRTIRAEWGLLGDGRTAVVEMAAASGLRHLAPDERRPLRASSRGTGQLIRAAIESGAEELIVALGGSATVDGGAGMAEGLGYRFFDAKGRELRASGAALGTIARIDAADYRHWLEATARLKRLIVASDVANTMLGPSGAARVFAPQKGATAEQVVKLEAGLENLSRVIHEQLLIPVGHLKGGGAAGGLGAGLVGFCGGALRQGARVVADRIGLDAALEGADWAITGEGCLDSLTRLGKAPAEVARRARKAGVAVIALAGRIELGPDERRRSGYAAAFPIVPAPVDLDEALNRAGEFLEATAHSVGALLARR